MSPHPTTPAPTCPTLDTWRIDRIPGRRPHLRSDGRLALPLWLVREGNHHADAELTMSPPEAERLLSELGDALAAAHAAARTGSQP